MGNVCSHRNRRRQTQTPTSIDGLTTGCFFILFFLQSCTTWLSGVDYCTFCVAHIANIWVVLLAPCSRPVHACQSPPASAPPEGNSPPLSCPLLLRLLILSVSCHTHVRTHLHVHTRTLALLALAYTHAHKERVCADCCVSAAAGARSSVALLPPVSG